MLRALTIILLVIGVSFVAWSLLVMTGGRDRLVAAMTEDTTVAEATPPQAETPTAEEPAPAEAPAPPDEAKPTSDETAAAGQANEESQTPGEEAASEPTDGETAEADQPAGEAGKDESAGAGKPAGDAAEKPAGGEAAGSVDPAGNPLETAKAAEKGSLKSPYADNFESVAEEGHKKYMAAGCNGCHGGGGGGGMGPPLTNPVWVYGNDGDTLFRLIALGTVDLEKQGYTRKGSENVVGPMPPMGGIVKSNDDLWKIIAWIWSVNPPDKSASAAQ